MPVGYAKFKDEQKKVLKSFVERKDVFVSRCGRWYLGLYTSHSVLNIVWQRSFEASVCCKPLHQSHKLSKHLSLDVNSRDRLSSPCLKRLRHNDIIRELHVISRAAKQSQKVTINGETNNICTINYLHREADLQGKLSKVLDVIMTLTFYPPPLNDTAFQAEFNTEKSEFQYFKFDTFNE